MAPALSVYPVRGPAFTPTAAYERAPYLFAAENPLKTGVGGPIPVAAHYGGFSASASPGQTPDTTPRSPLFYVRDPSLPQTFPERGAESAEGESMDKTGVNDEDEVVPPWSWTPNQLPPSMAARDKNAHRSAAQAPVGTVYAPSDLLCLDRQRPMAQRRAGTFPGQDGDGTSDEEEPDMSDIGWLDSIVGAVPFKNGDLAASVVFLLATLCLIPFLAIRLLRRSSLISQILGGVFLYIVASLGAIGVRAYLSNNTPTTTLMIAENVLLQITPIFLLDPILALLALYSQQGNRTTGVPQAITVLRVLNFIVLLLFSVSVAYTGVYLSNWNAALERPRWTNEDSWPAYDPPNFTRIAPLVASIIFLAIVAGAALLIPAARGDNGNMRPGGYLLVLLVLLAITGIYRVLQSLHAQEELNGSPGDPFAPVFGGGDGDGGQGSVSDSPSNSGPGGPAAHAPPGMYSVYETGIAWAQLQDTRASRGTPQTPVIFWIIYILPQWLMAFLLFFAHAPGGTTPAAGGGGSK